MRTLLRIAHAAGWLAWRWWRARSGTYSMMAAVLAPVLIGFVALGTEVGVWYYDQQWEQAAADSAAYAAAVYYRNNMGNLTYPNASNTNSTCTGSTVPTACNAAIQAAALLNTYLGLSAAPTCAAGTGSETSPVQCLVSNTGSCTAPSVSGTTVNTNFTPTASQTTCIYITAPPAVVPSGVTYPTPTSSPSGIAFDVVISQMPAQLLSITVTGSAATISARAAAQALSDAQDPSICMLALGSGEAADEVAVSGGTTSFSGCNLSVDCADLQSTSCTPHSGAVTQSGGTISTQELTVENGSSSSVTGTVTCTLTCQDAGSYVANPFSSDEPSLTSCSGQTITSGSGTSARGLTSGSTSFGTSSSSITYLDGLYVGGATVTLEGTIYICPTYAVSLTSGTIETGTGGATIVLVGSGSSCPPITVSGGTFDVTALASTGVAVTQSSGCNTAPAVGTTTGDNVAKFAGGTSGPTVSITGAVNLPYYALVFSSTGSPGLSVTNTGCTQFISDSTAISGGSISLSNSSCVSDFSNAYSGVYVASLSQ